MILAFFGKELDGAQESATWVLKAVAHGIEIKVSVKDIGLPAQFSGRVAIGVGDQREPVQGRYQPVHVRVGGQTGLQGKDMGGEIVKTILNAVKARLGTEHGEPRGPDMGRHQETLRRLFQEDLQQVAGIKPQDRPAVGMDIADTGQLGVDPGRSLKIGHEQQVMHLAHLAVPLVDGTDLSGEHEPTFSALAGRAGRWGQYRIDRTPGRGLELEKSGLSRFQGLLDPGKPAGMGEITGAEQIYSLDPGPGRQADQVALFTGGPGKRRMDMEVGNIAHSYFRLVGEVSD